MTIPHAKNLRLWTKVRRYLGYKDIPTELINTFTRGVLVLKPPPQKKQVNYIPKSADQKEISLFPKGTEGFELLMNFQRHLNAPAPDWTWCTLA